MSTYHGSQVKIRLERLTAEGKIEKEYLGVLSGAGVDQDFYTKNFPITTGAGATTDAETNVNVFTRVSTGLTWVELSNASEAEFAITGATGKVTVKAAKNAGGDAGKLVSISYYTTALVARGQGVNIDFAGDLEDVYELGNRAPQELKEGHTSISGTIEALYITRDLLGKTLGISDYYQRLTDYSFYLFPNGETVGQPRIKLSNVKFSGGSLKVGLKALVAINVTYKGLALAMDTVPA
jgi:hypothetical protein